MAKFAGCPVLADVSRLCRRPGTRARTLAASRGAPVLVANTRSGRPIVLRRRAGPDPGVVRGLWRASMAMWGRARVRRDFSVLVSPWARTDRHTAALAGMGGVASGSPKSDVFPAQGAGFFGADAGGQAQGDVGVHPGADGSRQERGGLVQGQALARPPRLPFRGIDQGGDVAADQVAAFSVADRAGQCVVSHRHRGGRVAGRHRGEGLRGHRRRSARAVSGSRSRSGSGPGRSRFS